MAGDGDSEANGAEWDVSQPAESNLDRPEGDAYPDFPDVELLTQTDPIDIEGQLRDGLEAGLSPAAAVRRIGMFRTRRFASGVDGLARGLPDPESQRLVLYQDLTGINSKYLDEELSDGDLQRALGLSDTVSERTIDAIRERMGSKIHRFKAAAASVAEWAENAEIDTARLRDAPEPVADGIDPPELVKLTRTMKTTGYEAIQLNRIEPTYDKWELFKPYEVASHDNIHPNNTRDTLKQKPYYWNREAPTSKALWNQVRDYSRGRFRLMFITAFEQYLDLLDRYNLVPDSPDLAVDITGWPWFGEIDDEDTPPEKGKQPDAVEGTKPGRNHSHSWQFATISLTNVPVPMTFGARSVQHRYRRHYHLNQLLNYADAMFEPGRVFLDKDFYARPVKNELKKRGQDFIIGARRKMKEFDDLIMGTEFRDENWNSQPYEIGVEDSKDADHYLLVAPSEKRLKRSDTGLEDHSNWEAYYTNIDPEAVDGGGQALAEAYRLRWAIETAYRVLKHEFMPKSASPMRNQRVFLFNWAILLNNMWMGANVLAAARARDYDPVRDDHPLQVKDEQGNYEYTANEFMTALVDDFSPVEIGEVMDLSLKSEIVRRASGMDLTD